MPQNEEQVTQGGDETSPPPTGATGKRGRRGARKGGRQAAAQGNAKERLIVLVEVESDLAGLERVSAITTDMAGVGMPSRIVSVKAKQD